MTGKSPVTATDEQRAALKVLAQGADRAAADRARALLLTLDGWTSAGSRRLLACARIRCDFGAAISPGAGSMP